MEESTSQPGLLRNQLVGQRIGSYRILDVLGSGGMSTVYRAVHVETGHEVALKVLLGTLSRTSTLLQRFLREARSAETLEHSNIVTIYDRGVDQGRHYLVLEYVAGGDFHEHVQRNGPLGAAEAVAVIRGIASGLRYAAGRGLIHRDIKPSNILRTSRGEPKIIDLGLALQSEFEDERVTREGTTVGTVDYMAPEQARDSRATSIHSDMYSLGCTFYYLLAGVPPYPGGDITEKLTRHARAPAPDIRDLRQDIPADVASILLRMMAKQPEDRYADYDQLIAALDSVGRVGSDDAAAIALAPLEDGERPDAPAPPPGNGPARGPGLVPGSPPDPDSESLLAGPLDGLSLELADERESGPPRSQSTGHGALLPRIGRADVLDESEDALDATDVETHLAPRGERPLLPWILATSALATLAIALAIGLHMMLGGPGAADVSPAEVPDRDGGALPFPITRAPVPSGGTTSRPSTAGEATKPPAPPMRPPTPAKRPYQEPEDRGPVAGDRAPIPTEIRERRGHLPEWTRAGASVRPEDPQVVVRRVPDAADGLTEPSLNLALNRLNLGTVEVADVGPLAVDDLHMSGESRVIRARRGYRPILRILRSRLAPALEQSAFFLLKQKSLTIEGIDFIVDARDLSGNQTALFGCVGSNLTLRDCTITVLNGAGARFTLIRQEASPRQERAQRPSRIWLDRTLVRGRAFTLAELAGGPVDLVLDGTAILDGTADPGGGVGTPIIRVARPEGPDEQRIFLAGAILACPGPVIRCEQPEGVSPRSRPLVIRSDGSALGRLQEPGIASIVTATDARTSAERQVAWAGDSNLFAGWKGFFARKGSGSEPPLTITVDGLKQARSTWNAAEQGSEWILADWGLTRDPTLMVAVELRPMLAGTREGLMAGPARPNVGLFPKTIDVYPQPMIPDPSPRNPAEQATPIAVINPAIGPIDTGRQPPPPGGFGPAPSPGLPAAGMKRSSAAAGAELVMNTADPRWDGDLGAFLRGVSPGARHVRVRVIGSGAHRSTPVRLPDGMILEVRVEAEPAGADLPTWSPDPQKTGPGLIEIRDGALVLSNLHLRHDPASRLESLLAVDDSHLVLDRCRFTVPTDSGVASGDLIAFRAPTTRPMPSRLGDAIFQARVDRPVCRLIDTILIANRTALRAELGWGLVALSGCAVASDETAIQLDPARVARSSFVADLWLDRCTIAAARSIVGLGHWPGVKAGPDRPWVLNSRRCVFATLSDARSRDAALLRVDADAYAGGTLFWQADGDAYELDRIVAAGETAPAATRPGELHPWFQFWAGHHATRSVIGPRNAAPRFRRRPRPGRIEPSDLILETPSTGRQGRPVVGADPRAIGGGPQSVVPSAPPN